MNELAFVFDRRTVAVTSLNRIWSTFVWSTRNDCPPPRSIVTVPSPKVTSVDAKPVRSAVSQPATPPSNV